MIADRRYGIDRYRKNVVKTQYEGHLISICRPASPRDPVAVWVDDAVKYEFAHQELKLSGVIMAQQCDICGKKPQAGNRISHAHNVTKRRWNVNLRPVHARVGATTKRMRVCTSCLRSGKVVKA